MVDVIQVFQGVRTILRKTFGVILETEHVDRRDYHSSCKDGSSDRGPLSYEIKRTQRQAMHTAPNRRKVFYACRHTRIFTAFLIQRAESRFYLP